MTVCTVTITMRQNEREMMSLEDDWTPSGFRRVDGVGSSNLNRAAVMSFDLNTIPGGEEGACAASTTIQLAWRQRAARIEARRRLATVYVKRPAPGGWVYYEHIVTGESQWERPMIAARLFPNSTW